MIQVRRGIFETNSSSTHEITMCDTSDFQKWKDNELVYDVNSDCLVQATDEILKHIEESSSIYEAGYATYEKFFCDEDFQMLETFVSEYNGVVAFGRYGYE